MINRIQLVEALKAAAAAAEAADPINDGGTCNLDHPAIRVERIQEKVMQEIAKEAGVEVSAFDWFGGKRWYSVHVPLRGQANRRTVMAEAADKVLREKLANVPGVRVCLYQQMD